MMKRLTHTITTFLIICALSPFAINGQSNIKIEKYLDTQVPIEERIDDLLQRLTLEEKINLLHGNVSKHTPGRFLAGGLPAYGIPQISTLDGRQGVRTFDGTLTTALPSTLSLSCTWDKKSAYEYGELLAEEMLAVKSNVLFAPMINLVRTPLGGRNFENLGEDPILAGKIAASYINGVQSKNVAACACLIVANDYEKQRHFTSSNMDERTLREVHLLPYEIASSEGNVWTMMPANSLLNGIHCAQNKTLLQDIMKNEIGFDGVMITDWRAAYEAESTALAGTDITMGFCAYVFGDGTLLQAVKEGKVPMEIIDDKVRRVLRLYIRTGMLNPEILDKGSIDTKEHRAFARKVGAEGMVLLKNKKNILPIDLTKKPKILLTGPGADIVAKGTGSGNVHSKISISPLEGLRAEIGNKAELIYEINKISDTNYNDLEEKAKDADYVLYFAVSGRYAEGSVLTDMNLPGNQNEAIKRLARNNKNVIVVLMTGSAVSVEPWIDDIPAVLGAWFAGQATGEAISDILTGKVNPSGKLSFTMAKKLSDYPVHNLEEWPAQLVIDKDPGEAPVSREERKAIHAFSGEYKEGVLVGHRWFDTQNITPRFEFGFGLSYTSFEFSDLIVNQVNDSITAECSVRNTGKREGAEVVQLYVSFPKSSVESPPLELKGFEKVFLNKGEAKRVKITLAKSRLSYYDTDKKKWVLPSGEYKLMLGNSSRNILLNSRIIIEERQ
ncbi:MAG: beta-glucosidase [Bacteroidales bacterium]